eukprot:scaffold6364_cov171-Amphora_coffeaeformis.AAC.6
MWDPFGWNLIKCRHETANGIGMGHEQCRALIGWRGQVDFVKHGGCNAIVKTFQCAGLAFGQRFRQGCRRRLIVFMGFIQGRRLAIDGTSPLHDGFGRKLGQHGRIVLVLALYDSVMSFVEPPISSNTFRTPRMLFGSRHTGQCQFTRFVGSLEFRGKCHVDGTGLEPLGAQQLTSRHGLDTATDR